MKKLLVLLLFLVTSCSSFKVTQRDPKTGHFKTTLKAPIIESKNNINLDSQSP